MKQEGIEKEMKHKIEITNTAIIINDYNLGDCPKIENSFKSYDPIRHTNFFIAMHYDEDAKKLYLPRGIDIWFVENTIGEEAYPRVNEYYRYQTFDDVWMKFKPRDEVQKEALRFTLSKGEYRNNEKRSQLSLNLPTGKGKTFVMITTLAYYGIRGIIITSSIEWLNQWNDRTVEYTNIPERDIYHISGSANISRIMSQEQSSLDRYKLFLVTHDTLYSYASNNGWESIGDLFRHLKIGIKVFDEAHLNFDTMCMIDYYTNVYKTYYLTATPAKSDHRANMIYQTSFKNVPGIELFDPETDPHTNYVAIHYNSRPTPIQVSSCRNAKYGLDRNRYTDYVAHQPNFSKLLIIIMDLALKATMKPGTKMLFFIGTNKAIGVVYEFLINTFPFLENDIGIYTSVVSKEEKEIAKTKRVILSTTKSAGAAVDIPGLKVTVVLAEPFKSEVITKQTLGRTRADNTMYIEAVDKGFSQCMKYYYDKQSILKTYAKSCSVIRLSDLDLENRSNEILEKMLDEPRTEDGRLIMVVPINKK